jgi:hypothetical protein
MTSSSPLPLATRSFLNVRCATVHDVARRSCRFVRVRPDMRALIGADMRVIRPSAKHLCAVFKMAFRLQLRQATSVAVIVADKSP